MQERLKLLKEQKKYFEYMSQLAENNGGELVSKEWLGWEHKYEFHFVKGDTATYFTRKLSHMTQGKYLWPQSLETIAKKNESKEDKYKKLQEKAIEMGGKLLSEKWLGCSVKHSFETNGVVFQLTPKEVTRGQWIQDRGLVAEPICRQIFEHLFGYEFKKTKTVLTSDKTGSKKALELDGYCEELNLAFEYQGHRSHWDEKHPAFAETVLIDNLKKETCDKLGIILVVIDNIKSKKYESEVFFSIVLNEILKTYQKKNKILPKLNKNQFCIDFSKINHSQEQMKKLATIAENHGCTLITKEWSGSSSLYEFMENKTGRILRLTSLSINNSKKGFPKNIDLHFKLKNAKKPKI